MVRMPVRDVVHSEKLVAGNCYLTKKKTGTAESCLELLAPCAKHDGTEGPSSLSASEARRGDMTTTPI